MTIELDVMDAALVQVCLRSHYERRGETMAPRAEQIRDRIDIAGAAEQAIEEAVAAYAQTLVKPKGSV